MLHAYWVVVITHFVVQIGCFLFLDYDRTPEDFIIHVLIWPTASGVASILIASWIDRRFSPLSFYAMSAASTVVAWTIIHVNYDIRIIQAISLLPIFTSVLF